MQNTDFLCPNCESGGKRIYLTTNNGTYFYCPDCNHTYSTAELLEDYTAMAEALEEDASFMRNIANRLKAA